MNSENSTASHPSTLIVNLVDNLGLLTSFRNQAKKAIFSCKNVLLPPFYTLLTTSVAHFVATLLLISIFSSFLQLL